MALPLQKVNHLAPFTQLSPTIYVHEPDLSAPDTDTGKGNDYPKTIVIAFWMNAFSRTLVKYIAGYRRLVPRARLIFIRTSSSEFILRPTKRAQYTRLQPAVEALRSLPPDEPVFMHMFSNGGVFAATHLLEAYQIATGRPLVVSSTVIDSAPGTANLSASIKAFSYILPKRWILRLFAKMLLVAYLTSMFVLGKVVGKIFGVRDAVSVARQVINDKRVMRGSVKSSEGAPRRCYIYSDADELVDWRDVERHAEDAEQKGFLVRREKFLGSEHVAHMKADPKRYWRTVGLYLSETGEEKTVPGA
ncbi:hypothetical protein BDV06DRAFT_234255 [Aspergillus oleicola]